MVETLRKEQNKQNNVPFIVKTLVYAFSSPCVQGFVLSEERRHVKVVWRSAITETGAQFVTMVSAIQTPLSPVSRSATGNCKLRLFSVA